MKKIMFSLMLCFGLVNAEIVLTKELADNNIGADQYQLFITNTANVSIEGLEAREAFFGTMEEYMKMNDSLVKYPDEIKEYEKLCKAEVEPSNVMKYLQFNPFPDYFDGPEYIYIANYFDGNLYRTRVIKYLVSDDDLVKDEQLMIFNTTSDTSYRYTEGKINSVFSTKREIKNFKLEVK